MYEGVLVVLCLFDFEKSSCFYKCQLKFHCHRYNSGVKLKKPFNRFGYIVEVQPASVKESDIFVTLLTAAEISDLDCKSCLCHSWSGSAKSKLLTKFS